jgi:hypothetical protein
MNPPIDDTAAEAEPDTAPKSMHVSVFTYASPPGKRPTSDEAKSISRRAIPPSPISTPDSTKNGIASSGKLAMPVESRCATT